MLNSVEHRSTANTEASHIEEARFSVTEDGGSVWLACHQGRPWNGLHPRARSPRGRAEDHRDLLRPFYNLTCNPLKLRAVPPRRFTPQVTVLGGKLTPCRGRHVHAGRFSPRSAPPAGRARSHGNRRRIRRAAASRPSARPAPGHRKVGEAQHPEVVRRRLGRPVDVHRGPDPGQPQPQPFGIDRARHRRPVRLAAGDDHAQHPPPGDELDAALIHVPSSSRSISPA